VFISLLAIAGIPPGYYNSAENLSGTALQQALHNIIDNHTVVSYASLWTWFRQTDKKPNGKVWDMYSDIPGGTPPYEYTFTTNQCGNYNSEGDCYNREHSWPESWFGGGSPMSSDIFHLYPTDGWVNNKRGNYPFGEVGTATWTSLNGSRLGNCVSTGYSGTVFEPRDEYKGDLARTYFYMATRYYGEDSGWPGSPMTSGSQPLPWAMTQLFLWHLADPVSQKELNRNDSIYANIQHNRNPFIDHPEYAALIWPQYMPAPGAYTWNVTSGNWSAPASWTPARTVAVPGDILIFNGAVKAVATATLDISGTQVAGRIRIINNASVTITGNTSACAFTVGVTGSAAPQLEIAAGSALIVNGVNPVTITLPAGYTGAIAGNVTFRNAAHLLTAAGAGAIVFGSGAVFTAGSGFSGSAFGTTSLNSVTFASGSGYVLEAGLPPFGAAAPSSVVVFQTGSLYKHKANSAPSLPGRTYANFEIDAPAFSQSVTTGASPCTIDNLTVTGATLAGFDFPGGCTILGNLQVNAGALRFSPPAGALSFGGAAVQTIGGNGALQVGAGCDVVIGFSSSVVLNKSLTLGKNITILPGGTLTVAPGITLTVNGQAVVN